MKYPLNPALPPLDFRDLPPEAVESYRSWFRREAHNRVQLLKSYVSSFDPNWTADFSESSFASIDQLFSSSIAVRELSNKELAAYGLAISPTSRPRILVPASMSFAYDIGIYLGESLTRSAAGAKYEQYSKRDAIDFGQFVVTAGWIDLDPYSLIKIYGIRRSRGDKIDSLTTFFEAWCQRLMLPDPRKLARVASRSGGPGEPVRQRGSVDDEVAESWIRDLDESEQQVRGVGAERSTDGGVWNWSVSVHVAELAREPAMHDLLTREVEAAVRAVRGVTGVMREDREVWLVSGKPTGKALVSAVSPVVDRLGPLISPESE